MHKLPLEKITSHFLKFYMRYIVVCQILRSVGANLTGRSTFHCYFRVYYI